MTRIELIVIIAVAGVLAGIFVPSFMSSTTTCGCNTKALSNAKQIYLGLKMYAGDHADRFPDKTVDGNDFMDANEAYQNLIPDYIPTKRIFYLKTSAWTPNPPDEDLTKGRALTTGENHFAYVPHLADIPDSKLPLVADGFKEGEPGIYASDENAKGGVWKGKAAIVVRVDGSGKLERLSPKDFKVYGPTTSTKPADIFAPAPNWLEASQKPLNPK